MALLEERTPEVTAPRTQVASGELVARRSLREQIARLERQLGEALVAAFPLDPVDIGVALPAKPGPRVLDAGDLEAQRDALQARLREVRAALEARGAQVEHNRMLLERMLLEPQRHKFVRLRAADLGEGGCGAYHVKPRLGIIGMLMGWWHVKLSSGCPLAT
jgi:hypothetical protein